MDAEVRLGVGCVCHALDPSSNFHQLGRLFPGTQYVERNRLVGKPSWLSQ